SVFAGGFTLDGLEYVCADEQLPRNRVWEILDQLVKKSIVQTNEINGFTRYRLLDSIAEFGHNRLNDSGEKELIQRRHRDYYTGDARKSTLQWESSNQVEVIFHLREERANMAQALAWSFSTPGEHEIGTSLTNDLSIHWAIDGHLRDGRNWTEKALSTISRVDRRRGDSLWVAAWIALLQGDISTAKRHLDEAEELESQWNVPILRAYIYVFKGTAALWGSELDAAREYPKKIGRATSR